MSVKPVLRHVLHDHVDIDIGVGERAEHGGGDAGLVRDLDQRDFGLVPRIGDAAYDVLFHDLILMADQSTKFDTIILAASAEVGSIEARAHQHPHPLLHSELDRARLQHLGALRGHLQHLFIGDPVKPMGLRHDAGIGGIDTVDVRIDVAAVSVERRRKRNRARIRAAAA